MNAIQMMMEEHRYIKRMLKVVRCACATLLDTEVVPYEDFEVMIGFIKGYADAHHHGKEEAFLFKEMEARLGAIGMKLIRTGMLIEHDQGRLYIQQLQEAIAGYREGDRECKLDIIANAISYTHLLERHISKEDELVYVYGAKHLDPLVMHQINEQCDAFEEEAMQQGIQETYRAQLATLEAKYL